MSRRGRVNKTPRNRARSSDPAYRRARARCLAPRRIWCHLCGREIDKSLTWPHALCATADHLDPVAPGGDNLGPLAPAHKTCNERRGTLSLSDWDLRQAARMDTIDPKPDSRRRFRW